MRDALFVAWKDLRHALGLPQVWVWMLVTLRSILSAPVARPELVRDFAILLAAGALLFWLAVRSLNRRFAGVGRHNA